MKKHIYSFLVIVLLISFNNRIKAQINLEHTFNDNVNFSRANYISSWGDLEMFFYVDKDNSKIKFYNTDYSLYKTVTITPPSGYKLSSVLYPSKNLFNTDSKIEFLIIFDAITTPENINDDSLVRIYNENGIMIKDLGKSYMISYGIYKIGDQYKLSLLKYIYPIPVTYKTEIYSLPGDFIGFDGAINPMTQPAYPNPANTIINLTYNLNQGETAIMNIYNMNGQLIDQKQIDYSFTEILLNVSSYSSGTYIYEVNGITNKFIVN